MHCADVDYELWKLAEQGPKVHCRRSFHSVGALCALAIQSLLGKAVSLAQLTIVVLRYTLYSKGKTVIFEGRWR